MSYFPIPEAVLDLVVVVVGLEGAQSGELLERLLELLVLVTVELFAVGAISDGAGRAESVIPLKEGVV